MKFQAYLAAAALVFGLADAQCNANNCARAVTGTRLGPVTQQSRRQDCSSFLRTTITRPTSFVFVTATSTGTDITRTFAEKTVTIIRTITVDPTAVFPLPSANDDERQAATVIPFPRPIPFYASACTSASAYSSACSCWGIRPTLVTLSTNTVSTVTITSIDRETISITTPGTTTFTSFTRVTIAPSLTLRPSSTLSTSVISSPTMTMKTTTTTDDDSSSAKPTTSTTTSSQDEKPTH